MDIAMKATCNEDFNYQFVVDFEELELMHLTSKQRDKEEKNKSFYTNDMKRENHHA